jgi:site-specific DNA-methyltransferase (adenine-specific)
MNSHGYELHHGDCLEVMRGMPDKSVDAIITDPPYGTTACKWDNVIPFEPMWEQLKRLIKPKGAIVLFGSQPFTSALVMSNAEWFKYDWIWLKNHPTGFLDAQRRPLNNYENVSVFADGQNCYYPVGVKDKKTKKTKKTKKGTGVYGKYGFNYETTGEGYPVRAFKSDTQRDGIHPTQKPVKLLSYLVRTYTLEGETVLDFTMGSGTTGVACMETGRKFIGIELDAGYYGIAAKRIHEATRQQRLF